MADATLAAAGPVYVAANGAKWDVRDTATDEVYATEPSLRAALDQALTLTEAKSKQAVLHGDDGKPDGQWRWLPAAVEEATANELDGVKLTRANLATFASQLNAKQQAMPIDGGGAPAGMMESETHGLARNASGLANGYAHAAIMGVGPDGKAQLFFRAELIPEVAQEVDRGRLAFGSVHFEHSPPAADGTVTDVLLKTHGLTNRPVDQQIMPASAVRQQSRPRLARATSRSIQMSRVETSRGPALDVLQKVGALLGVDMEEELEGDSYCSQLFRKIEALKSVAQVEQITEGAPAEPAEAEPAVPPASSTFSRAELAENWRHIDNTGSGATPWCVLSADRTKRLGCYATEAEAKARLAEVEAAKGRSNMTTPTTPEARAADMPTGAEAETALSELLPILRAIIGKPDAAAADVIAEIKARTDQLTAAAKHQAGATNAGPSGAAAGEAAMSARAQAEGITLRAANETLRAENARLLASETRRGHQDWLRDAIGKRKLAILEHQRDEKGATKLDAKGQPVLSERFGRLLEIACTHGRALVEESLDLAHQPPRHSGRSLLSSQEGTFRSPEIGGADTSSPATYAAAIDQCMDEALKSFGDKPAPKHIVRAKAQSLAAKKWPHLSNSGADDDTSHASKTAV